MRNCSKNDANDPTVTLSVAFATVFPPTCSTDLAGISRLMDSYARNARVTHRPFWGIPTEQAGVQSTAGVAGIWTFTRVMPVGVRHL